VTLSSTGAKPNPVLDESGFQQLLAAAYVLQQHNLSLHAKDPRLDAAWIFSQISEIETRVRQADSSLADAAKLVGERLCSMTGAVSASVCLLPDGRAECVSEAGIGAQTIGRSLAAATPAALERLKNGRQFQSLDAQSDSRLDAAICSELGVRSLLAVPIQKSDETRGLIEVRWGLANAIHECDVRTCRLMANLLAEVLDVSDPVTDSTPQTCIEIQANNIASDLGSDLPARISDAKEAESSSDLAEHCRVCGRPFSSDETFCGRCSMPRVASSANGEGLQSKWASMWFMQQAKEARPERKTGKFWPSEPKLPWPSSTGNPGQAELREQKPETRDVPPQSVFSTPTPNPAPPIPPRTQLSLSEASKSDETLDSTVPEHGLRILEDDAVSDSTPEAPKSFFSGLRPSRFVRIKISRRMVALAICTTAAILFVASWLSWPAQSSSHLSWFDSLLVDFGLAEVQARRPAPVFAGNPNVRVWEDVHTALYYCPDSDLYGKTPGGRFSTQQSAQEDQFEPATRVACQ
jgi:hypothetical protein